MPPVANSSTSRDPLFPFLNLCPTWVQVILKNPSPRLVLDLGTSELPDTIPLANLARSYFYSRRVVGDFTSRQFVGKLFCNFRPTWSEVIRRNTNWQAGQRGATLLILRIFLWNNLRQIACQGKHPCDPSNNICDIGCTIIQSLQKKNFVPN